MNTHDLITAASTLVASCEEMDPDAFTAALNEWTGGASDKIAALRAVCAHLEAAAAARKAEAAAWAEAAKRSAAQADRVKALAGQLLDAAEAVGEVLPGAAWTANGGSLPLHFVEGFDAASLPFSMQRVKVEPDSDAIRAALAAGATIDGVSLGERGRHVRWLRGGGSK